MSQKRSNKMQPRRGDIFFADLREHGGEGGKECRPVIIIQNDKGNANGCSVIVAVITGAKKKPLPTHVRLSTKHGLKVDSTAKLEDIQTIRKERLIRYIGTVVNTEAEDDLDRAIEISFGLKDKMTDRR